MQFNIYIIATICHSNSNSFHVPLNQLKFQVSSSKLIILQREWEVDFCIRFTEGSFLKSFLLVTLLQSDVTSVTLVKLVRFLNKSRELFQKMGGNPNSSDLMQALMLMVQINHWCLVQMGLNINLTVFLRGAARFVSPGPWKYTNKIQL